MFFPGHDVKWISSDSDDQIGAKTKMQKIPMVGLLLGSGLSNNDRHGSKRHLESEFTLPQTLSPLLFGVEFLRTLLKFRQRKEKYSLVFTSLICYYFSCCGRATRAKKCAKSHDAHAKLLFCSLDLLVFCRSHCHLYHHCSSAPCYFWERGSNYRSI